MSFITNDDFMKKQQPIQESTPLIMTGLNSCVIDFLKDANVIPYLK